MTQRVLEGGAWRDGQTSFFRVNAWRENAAHLAESLHKGDRVSRTLELRSPPAGPWLGRILHVSPPSRSRRQARCGWPTTRRWRSRRSHVRASLVPGALGRDPRPLLLRAAHGPLRGGRRRRPADDRAHRDDEEESERSASRCTRRRSCSSERPARAAGGIVEYVRSSTAGTATGSSPSSREPRRR